MSDSTFIVAAAQLASGSNVGANLSVAEQLARRAVDEGAQLLVLPENFAYMGATCRETTEVREQDGEGPIQDFLASLAQQLGIWLVGGTVPLIKEGSERARSACLVYDHTGERVARYDKIHLFDVDLVEVDERYQESADIEPGDSVVVIDSPFGRMGLAVCYDLRFPEMFRMMADQGAELVALPAAFTALTGKAHWEVLVRARAIENLSYLVAAAQGGFHVSGRETHGHSMVVDPWGRVLAERPGGNGVVCTEINLELLRTTRRSFPCLSHRRIRCH